MQARKKIREGVQPTVLVAVLLSTMLLSGAAGYLVRGGLPRSQAPAVTSDTVPSWAHQGMGPTDADAEQAAPRQCEGYACTLEGERELTERALTSSGITALETKTDFDLRQQAVLHAASERADLGGFTTRDESVRHAADESVRHAAMERAEVGR